MEMLRMVIIRTGLSREQLIILAVCSVVALIGLILVILQKKDIIHPLVLQNMFDFQMVSGGTITLVSSLLGAITLTDYSNGAAVAYLAVFLALYILIQFLFRKKKDD